jgi:hypothetical protein
MREEPQVSFHSTTFGVLARTLSNAGLPVESGQLSDDASKGRALPVLRIDGAEGPVIAEMHGDVAFDRIEDAVGLVASISTPALLVAYAESSRVDVAWALDIASELAVLMLSLRPPEGTVLHVAVPPRLTARVPHVVSSARAAHALFLAGMMTISPLRWCGSTCGFDVEPEQWSIKAMRALAPRLGGTPGLCGCCSANDAAAYVSNYSERD